MVATFYSRTVGKKIVMAVTGLILVGFIIGHMLGNLKIFSGIDPTSGMHKLDVYGAFLREMGTPLFGHAQLLWIARIGLLLAVVLHIWSAISLTRLSQSARKVAYAKSKRQVTTYAARTMRWGGVIIFLFIVYHLLHLTAGVVGPDGFEHGKVYDNVQLAFRVWYIALFYLLAVGAVALHLSHGIWSMLQTLGISNAANQKIMKLASQALGVLIFLGYAIVPMSVIFNCTVCNA